MRDVEEKLKKYRDMIANELMKNGIYPDEISLRKRLEPIDKKLAMFQFIRESEGENFDINKYNQDMSLIYEDLEILYRLVYEFCIEKYESLKGYVDLHLTELEELAKKYSSKADFEISSTSLGETLFFQATGFDVSRENTVAKVNLGTIKAIPGAKIFCTYKGSSNEEDILFKIGDEQCTPYSYNGDYVTVPGKPKKVTYTFTKSEDLNTEKSVPITIEGLTPASENRYIIFAGKDCIKDIENTGKETVTKKYSGSSVSYTSPGKISFYVRGGSFIKFSFSKSPIAKNFSGYVMENMESVQKITIDHDASFTVDFETDGTVFAEKKTGIINEGILYYPAPIDAESFLVEEIKDNERVSIEASMQISNLAINLDPGIDMIAIKELSVNEEDTQ